MKSFFLIILDKGIFIDNYVAEQFNYFKSSRWIIIILIFVFENLEAVLCINNEHSIWYWNPCVCRFNANIQIMNFFRWQYPSTDAGGMRLGVNFSILLLVTLLLWYMAVVCIYTWVEFLEIISAEQRCFRDLTFSALISFVSELTISYFLWVSAVQNWKIQHCFRKNQFWSAVQRWFS